MKITRKQLRRIIKEELVREGIGRVEPMTPEEREEYLQSLPRDERREEERRTRQHSRETSKLSRQYDRGTANMVRRMKTNGAHSAFQSALQSGGSPVSNKQKMIYLPGWLLVDMK